MLKAADRRWFPKVSVVLPGIRAWMLVVPVDVALVALPIIWTPEQWKAVAVTAVLYLLLVTGGTRYRARLHLGVLDDIPSVLGRLLMAAASVAVAIALRHEQEAVTLFLSNIAATAALLFAGRAATTCIIAWSRRRRVTVHRSVLVGGGALAADLCEILRQDPRYGLSVVGFVDDRPSCVADSVSSNLGTLSELDDAVRRAGADVILVTDTGFTEVELLEAVRMPACLKCDLLVVPKLHHFQTHVGTADHIGSIPVMRIKTPALHGPSRMLKRVLDLAVAGPALLLTLPVLAVSALAVRIEGGPGVIFRQERVGRDGRVFECLKLRSMRPVDESESATNWSVASDDRVGPVGRLLRRTSIDELPQLWNIVRGDMSLVGPRPERPYFVDRFSTQVDRYSQRHRVQAGLTGLAQVNGLRGDTSIADRSRYDNYYIENWTLWLDIKIIFRTVTEVVLARGR
jgi:exopolysaccharide biosynthesis polyprenyl glycosylphosphotransferase